VGLEVETGRVLKVCFFGEVYVVWLIPLSLDLQQNWQAVEHGKEVWRDSQRRWRKVDGYDRLIFVCLFGHVVNVSRFRFFGICIPWI
jgi:hypothetical protein